MSNNNQTRKRRERTILDSLPFAIVLLGFSSAIWGQIITTVAGGGVNEEGVPATQVQLNEPRGVAVDDAGNLYIADWRNHRIRKVDRTTGLISTFAGDGQGRYTGDGGPAVISSIQNPTCVIVDNDGHLYIADESNQRVRRVDAITGLISTVAGNGERGYSGDGGPATQAQFRRPEGITLDDLGNLYIVDRENQRIRRVDARTGIISTVAGNGVEGNSSDGGLATQSSLNWPEGVTVDADGNLYIADNIGIRRVDAMTGVISTVAGTGVWADWGNSDNGIPAIQAPLRPRAVTIDVMGILYIADRMNHSIRRVDTSTGLITTIAGTGEWGESGDGGPAAQAQLWNPASLTLDKAGHIYFADSENHLIRRIDAKTGSISTIAGTSEKGYPNDNGPATLALLSSPRAVAVDGVGNLYIADSDNYRIRKVDAATGFISTIAGNGKWGRAGDGGLATRARLSDVSDIDVGIHGNIYIADSSGIRRVDAITGFITTLLPIVAPRAITTDKEGNLYVIDPNGSRIRRIDAKTGLETTVVGGPMASTDENINASGIAVDDAGNLYIAETFQWQRIRRIDAVTGIITTIAGNGKEGSSEDGIPATQARLMEPSDITVDVDGNLYIAEGSGHRVRRVDAKTGLISTIAGNGERDFFGESLPATQAHLDAPSGIAIDDVGNLFIADKGNHRIRRVDSGTGLITTVAGSGKLGSLGDGGPAPQSKIKPQGLAIDTAGHLYISDVSRGRIRRVDARTDLIISVAGNSECCILKESGTATQVPLYPADIAIDAANNLYITDVRFHRVHRMDAQTGLISTIVGNDNKHGGYSGDGGPATQAWLLTPSGITVDGDGHVYIADKNNDRIRRVEAVTGIITTIAGDISGFGGDGQPAIHALLRRPNSVTADSKGNLYIADTGNHRIRRIDATTGLISTVAGNGWGGYDGDGGPATQARLNEPYDVALDALGHMYIADHGNSRIRRVDVESATISTVAGNGEELYRGYTGDGGPATQARIRGPLSVALDQNGHLYIADSDQLVRKVTFAAPDNGVGPADFDGDGAVTLADFFLFVDGFGSNDLRFDLDENGLVDLDDFFLFVDHFGEETAAKLMTLAQEYLGLPLSFRLNQNYPNPFNSGTIIDFALPSSGIASLKVYNLVGQQVATLVQEPRQAGAYTVQWDGRNTRGQELASGVYLYRLQVGPQVETRKLLLVR